MGFAFTQAAFNTDKARGLNKLVLWIICEHANEKNKDEAWPSIPTIAIEAGVCVNTVMKATRFLEANGLIQVVRTRVTTKDGKPQNLVNRYKPIISAMTAEGGGASDAVPPTPCDAVPYSTTCTTPTPPDALPPGAPDAPPYCTTCTVTSNEPVMFEPVTVNPVNQKGQESKEGREKGSEAPPPPIVPQGDEETFSSKMNQYPAEVRALVAKLNPMGFDDTFLQEAHYAQLCVEDLGDMDACDLVTYNWIHKAPKAPKLRITSCQWLWERVLGEGKNLRLVNEFLTHDCEKCDLCTKGGLISAQRKKQIKQKKAAEKAWEKLEAQRREKLARYEFRHPTMEEQQVFKGLRQGEWPRFTPLITSSEGNNAAWDVRHLDAAILACLQINEPQTFESFTALVEGIMELDKETPREMATTA